MYIYICYIYVYIYVICVCVHTHVFSQSSTALAKSTISRDNQLNMLPLVPQSMSPLPQFIAATAPGFAAGAGNLAPRLRTVGPAQSVARRLAVTAGNNDCIAGNSCNFWGKMFKNTSAGLLHSVRGCWVSLSKQLPSNIIVENIHLLAPGVRDRLGFLNIYAKGLFRRI